MRTKYTHIFFDLDNTLWDFETNSENAMKVACSKFLTEKIDFNVFFETYSEINHQLWFLYRQNGITKKELTRKRFQDTFEKLGIEGVNPEEMNEYYLHVMPDQKLLTEGTIELLDYLKSRFYKMAIITNGFSEVQHRKLETSGLKSYFSGVFISEEIKSPKPEKAIFEHALTSMNARKSQSIMIGDDWEVDVKGACKFGIDAVYFNQDSIKDSDIQKDGSGGRTKIFKTGNLKELMLFF
jgi:putative hydrolase of the HAD superfamily